jgi:hypothetical protein
MQDNSRRDVTALAHLFTAIQELLINEVLETTLSQEHLYSDALLVDNHSYQGYRITERAVLGVDLA